MSTAKEFLFNSATKALKDMLSNTDQVLMGNGVNSNGEMYFDVWFGLIIALEIIEQVEKENVSE